ncbi:MAG TPA: fasciclin domain-containing protein [Caulobacteraceae bacterium]|nr:fasciclin domain-containing protein [Caulobacteraceae bacterium]
MQLNRFVATAVAAALIACPAAALAQGAPPAAPGAPAAPPAAPPAPSLPSIPKIAGGPTIYDTLKASGQFTILLKAVDQTGLAPVLQSPAYKLTMFAPTDAAFNALPPDVLAKLMAPNDTAANQLQQILKYHLINAQVDSTKIRGHSGPVATVESSSVTLDGSNPDDLKVNSADIIQVDVRTNNGGIINVVDKVLIPSDSPFASAVASTPATPGA